MLQGYTVKRLEGKGYLVLAFFGPGYRISNQDMQLIMDVCPLRVDSIFVRDFQASEDLGGASKYGGVEIRTVLCISVLDIHQPVQITEAEVVRVRKRARGVLFSGGIFGKK